MPRRIRALAVATLAVAVLAHPDAADAHGIGGSTALPIPAWLFAWTAAVVLVVSFVGLATLWPSARLATLPRRTGRRVPAPLEPLAGAIGVALFAIVVVSGLAGDQTTLGNIAPTFVFVAFWVLTPLLSILVGDLFAALNPWRAIGRATSLVARRLAPSADAIEPLAWPRWLGCWPAVVGVVGFGWLELVAVNRDDPSLLAILALAYAAVQLVGMSLFGVATWSQRGDAFGVYFGLFARIAPLRWEDGRVRLRAPLTGLPGLDLGRGIAALVCAAIGVTCFDGLSAGPLWLDSVDDIQRAFGHLGLGAEASLEAADTVGLLLSIAIVGAFYALCIFGMRARRGARGALAVRFAHALVPVAAGYLVAHYLTLTVSGVQSLVVLASDPLGHGWNLFGTARWTVDYNALSGQAQWWLEVGALVAGHVGGLILAHDQALVLFRSRAAATRSQHGALIAMVGFTSFGLFLLSAANS